MSTVCRVCLAGGVNATLCPIENILLTNVYEKLTDSQFYSEDGRSRVVCCFCYQRLLRCWTLSEMACRSDKILRDLFIKGLEATHETIADLNLGIKQHLYLSPMKLIDSTIVEATTDSSLVIIKQEPLKDEPPEGDQSETESANSYIDECIKNDIICKDSLKYSYQGDFLYECPLESNVEQLNCATGKCTLQPNLMQSQEQGVEVKSDDSKSFQNKLMSFNQETHKTHHCKICYEKFSGEINLKRHMRIHAPIYSCNGSDKKFITKQYLLLQKKVHKRETQVKHNCPICDEKFVMKSLWKAHMKGHTKHQPFICDVCNKQLISRPGIIAHLKIHTGELSSLRRHISSHKRPLFACKTCNKEFTRKFYLAKHMRTHTGEDLEKNYPCDICGQKFRQKTTLVNHNKICHNGEKAGACHVCGKQFNQLSSLKRHLLSHNKEKPLFTCKTCNKGYSRKSTLLQHMKFHTGDEKLYDCNICDKKFNRKSNLKIHKRIHTGEKPYICSICDKQFRQKTGVEDHILRVHTHEKTYACNICDRKFYRKSELIRHSSNHTGVRKYACDQCGKRFNLLCILRKHTQQQHTDGKPYACNTCDEKFKYKCTLENHMSSHTGEKKYPCEICGKRFNRQPVLKRHVKQVHGKQGEPNVVLVGSSQAGIPECSKS